MTVTENLFRKTWENLDSHELRLPLNEKIGGIGQVNGVIPTRAAYPSTSAPIIF
jgi:hypothetical protein